MENKYTKFLNDKSYRNELLDKYPDQFMTLIALHENATPEKTAQLLGITPTQVLANIVDLCAELDTELLIRYKGKFKQSRKIKEIYTFIS